MAGTATSDGDNANRDSDTGGLRRRETRREVIARLAQAQKSNRGAPGYSRWVNRPAGRQLAALCYLAGLSPNQVSSISAAFTFSAIAVIALFSPSHAGSGAVAVALLLGYAFDSADGQVARLRGGGSPSGEWLDHVLDSLKTTAFHIAVAISWYRYFGLSEFSLLLIPLLFAVVASTFFFALILSDMLRRIDRAKAGVSSVTTSSLNPGERAPILRSLIALPNDYGLLCLTMALLPWHAVFITVYTALLAANSVFLVIGCVRWFHEMRGLSRPVASLTATGSF